MMFKRSSVLGLLLLAALAIVACAAPKPVAAPSTSQAQPAAPAAAAPAPVATAVVAAPAPAPVKAAAAAPQPAGEQPRKGGNLRVAIQQMNPELNVVVGTSGYTQNIYWRFVETLTNIDVSGEIKPLLAESWEVSPDARSFTFSLRKGVSFQDGTKLDAAAVKWFLDKNRQPDIRWSGLLQTVDKIEVVDPNKLRITTKESDATLLFNLGHRGTFIMPPSAFPDGDLKTAQFIPLGTGPFKVVGKRLQDSATLERFDGYWRPGVTFLDRITFFKVVDPTVRLAAVRSGDIDIIETAPLEAADRVLTNPNLGYLLKTGNLRSSLGFRVDFPPFDNVHVRRAFAHAIDRDAINKAALFGLATPNANYMWPGHWGYDANFKGLPYDPSKARQELALAGFSRGLKVDAAIWNRDPAATIAQIVQEQLKAVGIEVVLNPFDSTTASELIRQGRYGLSMGGTGSRDAQPLPQLDTLESTHPDNKTRGGGYKNLEVDALFKVLRTNPDQGERTRALKRINVILMAEDVENITFVDVPDFFVWNSKLRGVEAGYSYFLRINSVWWAETPKPGPLK